MPLLRFCEVLLGVETLDHLGNQYNGCKLYLSPFTREYHLAGVDNDYVVSTIHAEVKFGLYFPRRALLLLRAEATNNLVCCVDNDPLLLCRFPCLTEIVL